jgi:hypothetical protein
MTMDFRLKKNDVVFNIARLRDFEKQENQEIEEAREKEERKNDPEWEKMNERLKECLRNY